MKKSFRNYLRRSLLMYTAALILLFYLLYIGFMTLNLRTTTVQANNQTNMKIAADLNCWQRQIRATLTALTHSPEVQAALTSKSNETIIEANRLLYDQINRLPLKSVFALLDQNGQIVCTNLFRDNRSIFDQSAAKASALNAVGQRPEAVYEGYSRVGYAYEQSTDWLFATAITDHSGHLGTLLIDVTDTALRDGLRGRQADIVVLTDRFDNVIYTDSAQTVGTIGKLALKADADGFVTVDQKEYYVSMARLEETGLRVRTFSSTFLHQQMLRIGILLISLLAVALLCLAPLLASQLTHHNLRPVEMMIHTVRSQDLSSRIHAQTYAEFQPLYDEFNAMMERVQTLIRYNEELAERKRTMEVRHLKEQFNPHFVFNVMENLHFMLLSNPKLAADMLVAFSNLMRYEIDETQVSVPLETDMEYVSDYLLLQKNRYGKRLSYHIDIPQKLTGRFIPKLLVQPIVENSLKHGMPPEGSLKLAITARSEGGRLVIRIEDDGVGMPPDQLSGLQALLDQEDAVTTHIGLYNTHRALLLMYGPPCGLTLKSRPDAGTTVIVTVPEVLDNV